MLGGLFRPQDNESRLLTSKERISEFYSRLAEGWIPVMSLSGEGMYFLFKIPLTDLPAAFKETSKLKSHY